MSVSVLVRLNSSAYVAHCTFFVSVNKLPASPFIHSYLFQCNSRFCAFCTWTAPAPWWRRWWPVRRRAGRCAAAAAWPWGWSSSPPAGLNVDGKEQSSVRSQPERIPEDSPPDESDSGTLSLLNCSEVSYWGLRRPDVGAAALWRLSEPSCRSPLPSPSAHPRSYWSCPGQKWRDCKGKL